MMSLRAPSGWHAALGNPEVKYIAMPFGNTFTAAMKFQS
jgi:hypothetical protein